MSTELKWNKTDDAFHFDIDMGLVDRNILLYYYCIVVCWQMVSPPTDVKNLSWYTVRESKGWLSSLSSKPVAHISDSSSAVDLHVFQKPLKVPCHVFTINKCSAFTKTPWSCCNLYSRVTPNPHTHSPTLSPRPPHPFLHWPEGGVKSQHSKWSHLTSFGLFTHTVVLLCTLELRAQCKHKQVVSEWQH